MKILYSSWVREMIGMEKEDIILRNNVTTVEQLAGWLKSRGGGYALALKDLSMIRTAVNHEHVKLSHSISEYDEVAFFPPVTGG